MQLYNYTSEMVKIPAFTRLMQLEFFPYLQEDWRFGSDFFPGIEMKVDQKMYEQFEERFPSERGEGGIGSTG